MSAGAHAAPGRRIATLLSVVLNAALAGAACAGGSSAPADSANSSWALNPTTEPAIAGPATAHANLSASPSGVILSWVEQLGPTSRLWFSDRIEAGWSAPRQVASGTDWFVSYADPPQVMRRPNGSLVAAWLRQIDPRLEASNLLVAHSEDGGRTWSTPASPHRDGTTQQHAFPSFFELAAGQLGVVWLDGREIELDQTSDAGGAMSLRAATFDQQWQPQRELAVDLRVCECCPTAAAVTSEGPIVAYRGRSAGEVRNILVSRFQENAWTPPVTVHDDGWRTLACPVNGPTLVARDRVVVAAWFTVKDERGQALAAFSTDSGRTWGPPFRLDDGESLGRVDLELLDDGSVAASWVGVVGGEARLFVRRVQQDGRLSPAIRVSDVPGGSSSGFPRMARWRQQLIFAWTESDASTGTTRVRTASAGLP
ncbi:MAG: sialidase family protein [Vicinamibacterales bacterium]